MTFETYSRGLEVTDIKTGYRWRLEKRWIFKGREAMWECHPVNKQPQQPEEKLWFVGDIAESLAKV